MINVAERKGGGMGRAREEREEGEKKEKEEEKQHEEVVVETKFLIRATV